MKFNSLTQLKSENAEFRALLENVKPGLTSSVQVARGYSATSEPTLDELLAENAALRKIPFPVPTAQPAAQSATPTATQKASGPIDVYAEWRAGRLTIEQVKALRPKPAQTV